MDSESIIMVQGYLVSGIAAFLWGLSPLLIDKIKWRSHTITLIRNLSALLIAGFIILATNKSVKIDLGILTLLIILGFSGPGLADQLFVSSMKLIGANMATVLSYTYVFWASYIAHLINLERISLYDIIGSSVAFIGLFIGLRDRFYTNFDKKYILGMSLSLFSGFLWGISTIISKIIVVDLDPLIIVFYRSIFAVILMFLIVSINYMVSKESFRNINDGDTYRNLLLISISGLISFLFAYVLFLIGLYSIGVVIPSLITLSSPIITIILSRYIKKYIISKDVYMGAASIIAGLLIASIKYFY